MLTDFCQFISFPKTTSNPDRAGVQQRGIILGWIASGIVDPDLDHMDPLWFWSARSGSGSRRVKMTHKNSQEISCFEVPVLDVL